MHFFKALGVFLLLGMGMLIGGVLVSFEKRKCRQGEGFLALLRHIRLQIDCFSLPIPQILKKCDSKILADCGVESAQLTDLSALLRETKLYLPEEMCRLLWDFSAELGGGYREEQLRCCDFTLERVSAGCDRLRAELPKREKMMLLLPISFAGMLVLLLL